MRRLDSRFALEREIGAGGMSVVFLGRDEVLDRPVAIKVLRGGFEEDSGIGDRFRREGRTAARLSHPNIVQVYDAGEDELDGRQASYIVMEYVPRGDLKALLDQKGPLSEKELARIGADVASGLAHAHEKGIVHRDIKPQNILLDSYGRPKLSDFGIARALDATYATRTGSYLGTALYSSPEQLKGEKVMPKSDVYSLGVTLYQAAVGATPFRGTPIEVASQHVSQTPPEPSVLGADLSSGVEALILDCLRKNPDRRPTAEEVHERLREEGRKARGAYAAPPVAEPSPAEHTRTAPSEAPPARPPRGARREGRRKRWPILAAAALLLILLGVGTVYAANGSLLGSQSSDSVQAPEEENEPASSSESTEAQSTPEQAVAETTPGGAQEEDTSSGGDGGDSSGEAAAQTVQEFYTSAAEDDYDRSANLLSNAYRQSTWYSRGIFEGTFDTLASIEFTQGPVAQVNGNTATVSFSTIAYHTDRTDRRTGTATLVRENGEWKIDSIDV